MPQLGFLELIAIFVVALLVFGPKKLPDLGKSLGKGLREFRKATDDLKSTWEDQMRDTEKSVDEVKQTIYEARTEVETPLIAEETIAEEVLAEEMIAEETPKPDLSGEEVKPDGHAN